MKKALLSIIIIFLCFIFLFFSIKDYKILASYPYDQTIFTQGIALHNDKIFVSSGEYGKSFISKLDLESGKIYDKKLLPNNYFGESLTIYNNKIIQITWKENTVFIYDLNDKSEIINSNLNDKKDDAYTYAGEGWGITNSKNNFYMSNGTNKITVRDVNNFEIIKILNIVHQKKRYSL